MTPMVMLGLSLINLVRCSFDTSIFNIYPKIFDDEISLRNNEGKGKEIEDCEAWY